MHGRSQRCEVGTFCRRGRGDIEQHAPYVIARPSSTPPVAWTWWGCPMSSSGSRMTPGATRPWPRAR